MPRLALALLVFCSACGVADQPESARTVAAFEVPLPTAQERDAFLEILGRAAVAEGLHVDAATEAELEELRDIAPMTINAGVWRGEDDDEIMADALDLPGNNGRAWLTYSRGEDEALARRFRERSLRAIFERWPATRRLPILPNGGLPLPEDLRWTAEGYRVDPAKAKGYELAPGSPLLARDERPRQAGRRRLIAYRPRRWSTTVESRKARRRCGSSVPGCSAEAGSAPCAPGNRARSGGRCRAGRCRAGGPAGR